MEEVMKHDDLLADALAATDPNDPSGAELVAYARDAKALSAPLRERIDAYLRSSQAHRDRFRALAPPDWRLEGSCLCGQVGYALPGPLSAIGHCHCLVCRKAHSAAFGTFALVPAEGFRWTRGEALLTHFATTKGERAFCSICGTTLTGAAPPGVVGIALATLDVDPIARPAIHAQVSQSVAWVEVRDDLPKLPGAWEAAAS
jgi:hypothetical protein